MKRTVLVITLCAVALSACSTSRSVPATPLTTNISSAFSINGNGRLPGESVAHFLERAGSKISDKDVDAHIDSDITGTDRDIIKKAMLSMPDYARDNVIFVDRQGRIYANKKSLIATTTIDAPVPGHPGLYRDASGREFAGPPVTAKPTFGAGARRPMYRTPSPTTSTGPYRRVYSDPGSWTGGGMYVMFASGATSLDNQITTSVGPYNDQGYMYSGGWSSSGADSADAGLIYSSARNVADVFMSLQSSGTGIVSSGAHDFAPNQWLEVEFIIGCGNPCAGSYNSTGTSGPYLGSFTWGDWSNGPSPGYGGVTIVQPPRSLSDWQAYGTVVKAMVSLAQSHPPYQNNPPDLPGYYAYDGYMFGWIGVMYCGWSSASNNVPCYSSDPSAYHLEQYVPDQNAIMTQRPGSYGGDENVGINMWEQGGTSEVRLTAMSQPSPIPTASPTPRPLPSPTAKPCLKQPCPL